MKHNTRVLLRPFESGEQARGRQEKQKRSKFTCRAVELVIKLFTDSFANVSGADRTMKYTCLGLSQAES